jgi:WD40 repeat protein
MHKTFYERAAGMDIEATLAFTDRIVFEKVGVHLTDLQLAMLRSSWPWERQSYDQIADRYGYSATYLKHDVGPKLWKLLSEVLEEKVTKTSFRAAIERQLQLSETAPLGQATAPASLGHPNQDWGDAVDVSCFYGREQELAQLQQWCDQQARLIAIVGIGGMGKTALSVKLAQQLQDRFDWVIWRSLRTAPPMQDCLIDLLRVLSTEAIASPEATLSRLLQELRTRRCLLVLDNLETILQGSHYRPGYEPYGDLLRQLGETNHQSCVILTSREKPYEVGILEGTAFPVRSLLLRGLSAAAGQQLLTVKGMYRGTAGEWQRLVAGYSGNPLALKMIATTIQNLFDGDLAEFLSQEAWAVGTIRILIQQQVERLTAAEKTVLDWLALNREPLSLAELKADLFPPLATQRLIEILETLEQRCLIEKITGRGTRFSLQPVVMEYVTDRFVEQVSQEIQAGDRVRLLHLKTHALLKPQASDDVREAQIRLILQPILAALQATQTAIQPLLTNLLEQLRGKPTSEVGYAGGNLVNLLCQIQPRLQNFDGSNLPIWQADFRQITLDHVNFTNADLSRSAFAEALGIVFSVAFSPDGSQLATGDAEGGLRLWQTATGEPCLNLVGHRGWVWAVAFSPDGRLLASCSSDKTIRVWQVETGDCLQVLRQAGSVWSVAFSQDSQILASGSDDSTIRLWQVNTGECNRLLSGHEGRILCLAFSPDGQSLASGSDDQTLRIWDLQTGVCRAVYPEHQDRIWSLAFSPVGVSLPNRPDQPASAPVPMLASGSADQTIRLWSLATDTCVQVLRGHRDRIRSVAFSPDAQQLISSSDDQTLKIWQIPTGDCLQTLKGHTNSVFSVALNRDQIIASGSTDHTVKLWSAVTGRCLKTLTGYTNSIFSVAFHPQGQLLASGSTDRMIRLWDLASATCLQSLRGHQDWVTCVAFHPNGEWLASSSLDRTVRIWSVATGQCLHQLQGHQNWVQAVAFSPDGATVASGSDDQTIRIWSLATGQCQAVLMGHRSWVWAVAFSPDGAMVASSSDDQTIRIWSAETGDCLQVLQGHRGQIQAIAFSPDGALIASGSADQTVRIWSTRTGECLHSLAGHDNNVWAVAFSLDGQVLVSGSLDQTVRLWDRQTFACVKTLPILVHSVRSSIAFRPEAELTIATGSHDGRVRLWDLQNQQCLQTLTPTRPYEGTNITRVTGITLAQRAALLALGAVEES